MSNPFSSSPTVLALFRENILSGIWRASMLPDLKYRGEYEKGPWVGGGSGLPGSALSAYITKRGTMDADATPLAFGADPTDDTTTYEQYLASIQEIAGSVACDKVKNDLSALPLYRGDFEALSTKAAKSLNVMSRYPLYNAALAGQTVLTTTANNASQPVARINGFTHSFTAAGIYAPVSVANPLAAYIWNGAAWDTVSVIAATPTLAGDIYGPGTLTLAGAYNGTARDPICAATASRKVLAGGGYSIDDIGAGNTLSAACLREAVSHLNDLGVPKFPDGYYHLHASSNAIRQLRGDSEIMLQLRGQGLDRNDVSNPYVTGKFEVVEDCIIIPNSYAPRVGTVPTVHGTNGDFISVDTVNIEPRNLETTLILGYGANKESVTTPLSNQSGGADNKVGDWVFSDNNVARAILEDVEVVMTSGGDKLDRLLRIAYSYTGGFNIETDYLADKAGPAFDSLPATAKAAYKRSIAIIHTA